jgi:UTP--glucose-1-phosphate uridylyltransferase
LREPLGLRGFGGFGDREVEAEMKAIIPAAGMGTRFLPATKAQPKEMLPVLGKPVIQYVVEEALAAGASEVVIVSNDDKPSIREHFAPAPALEDFLTKKNKPELAAVVAQAGALPVRFVPQPEPLGLGHAVLCAAGAGAGAGAEGLGATGLDLAEAAADVGAAGASAGTASLEPADASAGAASAGAADERFFVLLGDVIVPDNNILSHMKAISDKYNNASVIAVFAVPPEQTSRFGIIAGAPVEGSQLGAPGAGPQLGAPEAAQRPEAARQPKAAPDAEVWRVSSLVEKPAAGTAPSNLAIFGRYLLSSRVTEILARTKPGAGGEIQLTDALADLLLSEEMYALVIDGASGFDTGTVASWLETNIRLGLRDFELAPAIRDACGDSSPDAP